MKTIANVIGESWIFLKGMLSGILLIISAAGSSIIITFILSTDARRNMLKVTEDLLCDEYDSDFSYEYKRKFK